MTYLQLCQSLAYELGIGGANLADTTPTDTTTQTGQLGNVVQWIAQSILDIDNMFRDWNYMSTAYSETLAASARTLTTHSGSEIVNEWDKRSMFLDYATDNPVQLTYVPWPQFRVTYDTGTHTTTSQPKYFSIKPNGTVQLDAAADKAYTVSAEFWKRSVLITGNNTEPDIPANFHRIIVAGAGLKYGNKESAPEVIDGMGAEYEVGMIQLMSQEAPGFEPFGMSADDQFLTMEIPHHDDFDGYR